ncbi:MAG: glycosyltransferase family A protein, partial [Acidobacteriota bacterium]
MSTRESLSVIVPTYNLAHLIEPTLRTVLAQTDLPDEVVVVDDGSTDDTLAIVQQLAAESGGVIRVIARPHSGPGATRNAAIAAARGTWIAFLDGDDLWLPEKLAHVRAAIDADPAATMVTHPCIEVNRAGDELPVPLPGRAISLGPHGERSWIAKVPLGRRGHFRVDPLQIRTGDPFG